MNDPDSIPTRQSLLARLKDVGDQESWRDFFDTYWRLIHATALKAGLTDSEAQEVVQEVMIAAAKKMPEFTYDPGKDSLKGWLLADGEWRQNLLRTALDRVKSRVNPAHYEMYHVHVVQGLSPRETARTLGVSTAAVHLAKHRVGRLVKAELRRLSKRGL